MRVRDSQSLLGGVPGTAPRGPTASVSAGQWHWTHRIPHISWGIASTAQHGWPVVLTAWKSSDLRHVFISHSAVTKLLVKPRCAHLPFLELLTAIPDFESNVYVFQSLTYSNAFHTLLFINRNSCAEGTGIFSTALWRRQCPENYSDTPFLLVTASLLLRLHPVLFQNSWWGFFCVTLIHILGTTTLTEKWWLYSSIPPAVIHLWSFVAVNSER